MNPVVNLEETPGKVVGRDFATIADYDRLLVASEGLMPRLPFPKGVFRFRKRPTHGRNNTFCGRR